MTKHHIISTITLVRGETLEKAQTELPGNSFSSLIHPCISTERTGIWKLVGYYS